VITLFFISFLSPPAKKKVTTTFAEAQNFRGIRPKQTRVFFVSSDSLTPQEEIIQTQQ
jgi:hypothetical protein